LAYNKWAGPIFRKNSNRKDVMMREKGEAMNKRRSLRVVCWYHEKREQKSCGSYGGEEGKNDSGIRSRGGLYGH